MCGLAARQKPFVKFCDMMKFTKRGGVGGESPLIKLAKY